MQHPPARIVGDEGDFDGVLPVNQDRVPPVGRRAFAQQPHMRRVPRLSVGRGGGEDLPVAAGVKKAAMDGFKYERFNKLRREISISGTLRDHRWMDTRGRFG